MSLVDFGIDQQRLGTLQALAGQLIPANETMPSAAEVLTEQRLQFVLQARSDLAAPLLAAVDALDSEAPRLDDIGAEPRSVIELVIVAAYYSDPEVKRLIGYPGQEARPVNPFDYPEYLEEGLIDRVVERGPIWRDPGK